MSKEKGGDTLDTRRGRVQVVVAAAWMLSLSLLGGQFGETGNESLTYMVLGGTLGAVMAAVTAVPISRLVR